MTALFTTSGNLDTTCWPLGCRTTKDNKFEYISGINAAEKSSLNMSKSFYMDSLLLNRPNSNVTENNYTKVLATSQQLAKKGLDGFTHHQDVFASYRRYIQDRIPSTSATRLSPLPPSSVYNSKRGILPHLHSSLSQHHHHMAVTSPIRSVVDNEQIGGYIDQRTVPHGVTTNQITRHGTPSPPSHLQYKRSIDDQRLSPHLPYGKKS